MIKIIWALPINENPKTGAEAIYIKLMKALSRESENISPKLSWDMPANNLFQLIKINFTNLSDLLGYDRQSYIFQDYYLRNRFIIANLILSYVFRRKIMLFVNEYYPKLNYFKRLINRLYFSSAHRIIVNSKATAVWVNGFGAFANKTIIFPPCVKDNAVMTSRTEIREKVRVLLCVANIRENKGQQYLINALSMLKNKSMMLLLVGEIKDIKYHESLLGLVEKQGLKERIRFCGFLKGEGLKKAYRSADIFILPTLKEGFGIVLLEAMSFGLPIIASNVGGVPELIEDGVNGLLVKTCSAEELAQAIERLSNNHSLRKKLANGAIEKYIQMPEWDSSVKSFLRKLV